MYKLSGHSLTRGEWFLPESQPFTLTERDSTCTIQLGPGDPEIGFNDWILDDEWPEGNYVWRVKNLGDTMNTETRAIELEHVIKLLDDKSLFGQVTTQDISGGSTATAKQAVQYILGQQSDWTLGDFAFTSVSYPYEFSGETLLDALEAVTNTLEDPVWEYDMNTYPFVLHIRQRSSLVSCEMRAGRNLSTLKRSVSRSGMYTRLYPIGKNDLHVPGNYLSKNESTYGRVDHIETDQSKSTVGSLQAWAQGLLNRHCEPTVTITISGLELSGETGETLDNLKLNKMCRCPLPEFGTTITERIVKKQWRDRRKEPENVTLNLCNSSADVASIIKEQTRSGGRGAAGQAKQNYLFEANGEHLYYEVFDECGYFHGVLNMTSQSLRIAFDNAIQSTRSEFQMTSESLRIAFENETQSIRSVVSVEAGKIEQIVSAVGSNGQVTAASIMLAINNDTSTVKISADEIDINGIVSALQSRSISVGSLTVEGSTDFLQGVYSEGNIASDADIDAAGKLKASGGIWDQSSGNVRLMVSNITKNNAGDTITVSFVDGTSWDFSKAASSVTLSGVWSGTVAAGKSYKVTASPGGQTHYSPSLDGMAASASSKTWASDYKSFDQEISVYDSNSEDLYKETLTFNTTPAWNAGSNAAGVVIDASNGEVKVAASTSTKSVAITADVVATYNSTTHKYSVRGIAKAGSTQMDSVTDLTGTEAYEAGVIYGQGAVYTGVTAREVLTSGGTTYYPASSTTVVGRGDSVTAREVVSSGGTLYYKSTGSSTVYPGNGGSFTPQGSTGPKLIGPNAQQHYLLNGSTYSKIGSATTQWYYASSVGTQYYNAGSGTKYDRGSSYTVYTRETSSIRLGDSGTYYKGNGGTKTVQGGTAIHLGGEETLYRRS